MKKHLRLGSTLENKILLLQIVVLLAAPNQILAQTSACPRIVGFNYMKAEGTCAHALGIGECKGSKSFRNALFISEVFKIDPKVEELRKRQFSEDKAKKYGVFPHIARVSGACYSLTEEQANKDRAEEIADRRARGDAAILPVDVPKE